LIRRSRTLNKTIKVIVGVTVAVITLIASVILVIVFFLPHSITVRHNARFDTDINRAIIQAVEQMLRVYYGRFDERRLEGVLSEELLQRVLVEDSFRSFREQRRFFYAIDTHFMENSLQHRSDSESSEDIFVLRINVLEGLRMTENTWHNLVIQRHADGTVVIIHIDYER